MPTISVRRMAIAGSTDFIVKVPNKLGVPSLPWAIE